jgi:hypothetical protein
MSNHTPAPWTIDNRAIYGNRGLIKPFIASVEDDHNDHETEANALLIAAAPELLEALERCTAILWDMTGYLEECRQEPEEEAHQAIKDARAAINKATGVRA